MSSFRKLKKVLKESTGAYVNGDWVAGERSVTEALMSVQPVVMGQDIQVLPEGRHLSDYVKLYASTELQIAREGEGVQSDIVVHEGYGFEIMSSYPNRSGVINHYKYTATKVLKYTSDLDWVMNITERSNAK